ncbi:TonB-dependent receptor [Larkinella harenae]
MKFCRMLGLTLLTVMKISFLPIFLSLLLAGASLAYDGKAQDLLQRPISIKADEMALKSVLTRLERAARVSFVYSSNAIPTNRKVSLNAHNQKLAAVLESLLKPLGLTYQVVGGQIVIQLPASGPSNASDPNAFIHLVAPEAVDRTITGTVTAENNEGLPGVSVVIKNTARGTTTDMDGKFRLSIPDGSATTLVFSFVGYENQEIAVGNQTNLSIQLAPDQKTLEEVVVMGYGTVQKKDLTGAVATVQGDAITTRKTTQISQALQGAVPGVTVTRSSNAPGATATIRVRGITTISEAGANPLIILDGVPIDDINSINPNDVENISVLKDAASASIYGSRAAAGVIVVTTKRAKTGQLSLDYTAEYGFERATQLPDYVGAKRYMQLTNELRWNDNGNNTNEYPTYPKDLIDNYDQLHAQDPDQYPNTNWRSILLKNSAPRRSHILSVSGSGKSLRSRVSFGYDKADALYDGRSYERITARVNNDLTITNFLSASIDFNFRRAFSPQPITDDRSGSFPFYKMGIMPAIYAATFSDGRIGSGKDGDNIYARMKYGGFNNAWYNQVGGKISLDFTPIKGLKITGVLSPFFNFDKIKVFTQRVPYTLWNSPDTRAGFISGQTETKLEETRNDNYRYTTQALANYTKQLGSHNLNLLAGYEYFYAFNEGLGASRGQYILGTYPYLNLGPLDFRDNSGSANENAYRSWFGRVMYDYQNKYLLQANIRYDASSRFASAYRWGAFPSVSAGWVLSEENFMKSKASWLSFLKLRASWGSLGNERIGNNLYPYQAILSFENNSLFYQGNTAVAAQAAAQFQYAIRDISWETTNSFDVGLDVNFFNDRLQVTGDYYQKTTRDILLELEIPDYVGFDNPFQNTGKMFTKGWEMQVGWNDRRGDLRYSASFNLSDFRSRMGDLGGTAFLGDQIKVQGSEFNEWYGYVSDGIYQTADEVANSATLNANVKPGDVRYRDISGPNGVPDGKISPEYDRVLLGGSLPRYSYGANINLGYKNWDFGLVLQGVGKQNSRLGADIVQPLRENYGTFPTILDGNTWSAYNTPDQNLQVQYPRYTNTSAGNNYAMSDFWLVNGAYFRLKNISLGYNIPQQVTQKLKMQNIRIYSSVTDLLSISKFPKGWDPERTSLGYPITTAFVFGASVKF